MNDFETILREICSKIIHQAVLDYKRALKGYGYEGKKSCDIIEECEKFFRSEFCRMVIPSVYPDEIIEELQNQVKSELCDRKQRRVKWAM